jgi:hypothetical protein
MPIVGIPQPQLFAVLGQNNLDKIDAAIKLKYPNDCLALSAGQWLIVTAGIQVKNCPTVLESQLAQLELRLSLRERAVITEGETQGFGNG